MKEEGGRRGEGGSGGVWEGGGRDRMWGGGGVDPDGSSK